MKNQGITVIGSNPIQSIDGSNPCPTLRYTEDTLKSEHKAMFSYRTMRPRGHTVEAEATASTRPRQDATRPRPQFLASRPRPFRGLNIPGWLYI